MGQLYSQPKASDSKGPKSNLKKPVKKIDRNLIGKPSNFQHTGHIGIGDMRKPDFDADKIKGQMAAIAASINLDDDENPSSSKKEAPAVAPVAPVVTKSQPAVEDTRPVSPREEAPTTPATQSETKEQEEKQNEEKENKPEDA